MTKDRVYPALPTNAKLDWTILDLMHAYADPLMDANAALLAEIEVLKSELQKERLKFISAFGQEQGL